MRVKIMGIQPMTFPDRETGEVISMTKLHVVGETVENAEDMKGQRCDAIGTRLDCTKLVVGKNYNLIYERPLGSSATAKARLVEITPVN